jgi:hypothetical protein
VSARLRQPSGFEGGLSDTSIDKWLAEPFTESPSGKSGRARTGCLRRVNPPCVRRRRPFRDPRRRRPYATKSARNEAGGTSVDPALRARQPGGYSRLFATSSAAPRFSMTQKCSYSLTTTSMASAAMCPGETAKRFCRERTSSHSRPDNGKRSLQSVRQHSHRKPAVGWPLSIHPALRLLRSRHQSSLCAMHCSREPNGSLDRSLTGPGRLALSHAFERDSCNPASSLRCDHAVLLRSRFLQWSEPQRASTRPAVLQRLGVGGTRNRQLL